MLIFAAAVALGAYLIGSIPSGYLVGRAQGMDLRKVGSGNIGATNALRVLGKKWGYFVFAADFLKGWLAVRIGFAAASHFVTRPCHPCGHSCSDFRYGRAYLPRLAWLQGWKRHCHIGRNHDWAISWMGFPMRSYGLGRFLLRHALCFHGIDCGGYLSTGVQRHFNALWTLRLASRGHRRLNVRSRRLAAQIKHRTPSCRNREKIREKTLRLRSLSGLNA